MSFNTITAKKIESGTAATDSKIELTSTYTRMGNDNTFIISTNTTLGIDIDGDSGLNGAVLTANGAGQCTWDGGALEARLQALELKAGIKTPEKKEIIKNKK